MKVLQEWDEQRSCDPSAHSVPHVGAHGPREEQAREPAHPTAHICDKRDEVPLHPHAQGCLNFLAVVVPALHSHIVQRYPVVCQM